MRFLLQLPLVRQLHQRGLLLPALVIAVVAVVLTHGVLHRDPTAEASDSLNSLPPPPTLPSLRPSLEKAPLLYESDYWRQVADGALPRIVPIGESHRPAFVVADGLALATLETADAFAEERLIAQLLQGSAPPGQENDPDEDAESLGLDGISGAAGRRTSGSGDGSSLPGRFTALGVDLDLGLALFRIDPDEELSPFRTVGPALLSPGMQLLAITKRTTGELSITPAYLASTHAPLDWEEKARRPALDVVLELPPGAPIAALVDLDGALAGLALRRADGMEIVDSERIRQLVKKLLAKSHCRAIEVEPLDDAVASLLQIETGVVVTRVRETSFLPEPSILPGDIVLNWGGQTVGGVTHFEILYDETKPGALTRFQLLRRQRSLSGATVLPGRDCRPLREPPAAARAAGLVFRPREDGGLTVLAVRDDSPAAAAGLAQGDRVVTVGGRSADASAFSAYENRPADLLLNVEREGRTHLTVLPAGSK